MKKFLLLIMAALAFSCSSDSDNSETLKLVSTITYYNGLWTTKYTMTYDSSNRITHILGERDDISDDVYDITYDSSSRVTTIDRGGDNPSFHIYSYDADGRQFSWGINGNTPRRVYYEDGIYRVTYGGGFFTYYSYNGINDVATVDNTGGGSPTTFNYDETKKGPFANVGGNFEVLGLYLVEGFQRLASRKALISTVASPYYTTIFTNSYDDDGYLTGFTAVSGDGDHPWATVTYIE